LIFTDIEGGLTMPCDRITRMTVKLKAADREILKAALKDLGYTFSETDSQLSFYSNRGVVVINKKGEATINDSNQGIINEINVAYSKQVVARTAARFKLIQTKTGQTQGKLLWRH